MQAAATAASWSGGHARDLNLLLSLFSLNGMSCVKEATAFRKIRASCGSPWMAECHTAGRRFFATMEGMLTKCTSPSSERARVNLGLLPSENRRHPVTLRKYGMTRPFLPRLQIPDSPEMEWNGLRSQDVKFEGG